MSFPPNKLSCAPIPADLSSLAPVSSVPLYLLCTLCSLTWLGTVSLGSCDLVAVNPRAAPPSDPTVDFTQVYTSRRDSTGPSLRNRHQQQHRTPLSCADQGTNRTGPRFCAAFRRPQGVWDMATARVLCRCIVHPQTFTLHLGICGGDQFFSQNPHK